MARPVKVIPDTGSNGCGTASLAMILNAFHEGRPQPRQFTQAELDEEIRLWSIFTAPMSAADLARRFGVAARICNDGDFKLLDAMVRRDNVCQLIVDAPQKSTGGNLSANLHYIVVDFVWDGRRRDFEAAMADAPNVVYPPADFGRWVRVRDSMNGRSYIISYDHLESRYWRKLSFGTLPTGFNNFVIVYGDTEADLVFPPGYSPFDASAAMVVGTNASEFLTALVHTARFYPTGLPKTIKNAAETALSAVAFIVKTPGTVLSNVSAKGIEVGKNLLLSKDSNILERTGGAIIAGVAAPIWLASKPVEILGNGFAFILNVFD